MFGESIGDGGGGGCGFISSSSESASMGIITSSSSSREGWNEVGFSSGLLMGISSWSDDVSFKHSEGLGIVPFLQLFLCTCMVFPPWMGCSCRLLLSRNAIIT